MATVIGGMTVAELLARISSRELTEWGAYFQVETLGDYNDFRADERAAIVAATVANKDRRRGQRIIDTDAFMPHYERPKRAQDPEAIRQGFLALAKQPARKGQPPTAPNREKESADVNDRDAGGEAPTQRQGIRKLAHERRESRRQNDQADL